MRLPLTTLEVFTAIAQHGSQRAAADTLGLTPSTISHQLKNLEELLGTPLFVRTTRSLHLTEAGRALLKGTAPAFQQIADAVESARTMGHEARGALKLALPDYAYDLLMTADLFGFSTKYPEIEIELSQTDALVDILESGFHAGIRMGNIIDENMVAIRLTDNMKIAVVGSPEYFERRGRPTDPKDLLQHDCIRYRHHSSGRIAPWIFHKGGRECTVEVKGPLIVNSVPAALDAASRGKGLAYVIHNYAMRLTSKSNLQAVLLDHTPRTPGSYLYYPRENRTLMPLKLFVDHLRAQRL